MIHCVRLVDSGLLLAAAVLLAALLGCCSKLLAAAAEQKIPHQPNTDIEKKIRRDVLATPPTVLEEYTSGLA